MHDPKPSIALLGAKPPHVPVSGTVPPQTAGRTKLASLDGWRALAITLVLASHMWASENAPNLGPLWEIISHQGNFGVRIFFTLSGFLITFLLLDEWKRRGTISLKAFYLRRIFRIFPVYYLFLAVLALAQVSGVYHDATTTWLGALTMTRNLFGQGDSATGHLWSLAVEEQFYLFWPICLVMLSLPVRRRLAVGILAAVVIGSVVARTIDCHGTGFLCRIALHPDSALRYADCLAIGCLGAFLRSTWQPAPRSAAVLAATAAGMLALSAILGPGLTLIEGSLLVDGQAWLAIVAMVASVDDRGGIWFRLMNARPIVFLGTISYSLYVWHLLFLRLYVGKNFPLGVLGNWQLWWVAAIAVAILSYFGFEQRFVLMGRKWRR